MPGWVITELILSGYNLSLWVLFGLYASLIELLMIPRCCPAGENQGYATIFVLVINPAISAFVGIYLKRLLNLSYEYLYPLSKIANDEEARGLK